MPSSEVWQGQAGLGQESELVDLELRNRNESKSYTVSCRSLGADPELHDGILDAVRHEAQKTLRQAWLKASQMKVGSGKPTGASSSLP